MKKAFLITMALVLIAIPAAAQNGYLGLFADPEGTICGINDNTTTVTVYVVHMDSPGATGAEFGLDFSGVPNLTYLSYSPISPNIVIEDPSPEILGFSIGYGGCFTTPRALISLLFLPGETSSPCSQLRMDRHPNPDIDAIQVTDCEFINFPVEGRGIYINPNLDCDDCSETPVATEIDSWGSLKSLYR